MPATWVETREVPLRDLTRYPGNPRRGNLTEIQASLRRHGQYRALIVRDTGSGLVILAGNHTAAALEAEHHTEARCEIITCTDDEAARIVVADNKIGELGDYDDSLLAEILGSLDDYEGTGWNADDVDDILATLEQLPVLDPQPTAAAYIESPEQLAERTERFADAQPRQAFGIREMVLVFAQAEYDEMQALTASLRKAVGADTTAPEAVLAGMRAAGQLISHCTGDDDCAWCR